MSKRLLLILLGIAVAGILVITGAAWVYQASNPPVVKEPAWNSPQTRALAVRACYDCHSNQTAWPWYDKLPFSSWLAVFDTVRGRSHLNFSEWGVARAEGFRPEGGRGGGATGSGGGGRGGDDMSRMIQDGSMPPSNYTLLHPEAVLSAAEKQQLIDGLQQSLK